MRAERIFQGIASLGAIVAMCLVVAAPARAALIWGAPEFNPTQSTTSLDLISTAELTGVGFDYFILTLIHPPEVLPLSVVAGAALPPSPGAPIPGWSVGGVLNDRVEVYYVGNGDLEGILPAGQLLTFKFAGLATPDVVASVMLFGLSDGELLPTPLTAPSPIPEPSSWLMMAAGLMGLGLVAARRLTLIRT